MSQGRLRWTGSMRTAAGASQQSEAVPEATLVAGARTRPLRVGTSLPVAGTSSIGNGAFLLTLLTPS